MINIKSSLQLFVRLASIPIQNIYSVDNITNLQLVFKLLKYHPYILSKLLLTLTIQQTKQKIKVTEFIFSWLPVPQWPYFCFVCIYGWTCLPLTMTSHLSGGNIRCSSLPSKCVRQDLFTVHRSVQDTCSSSFFDFSCLQPIISPKTARI